VATINPVLGPDELREEVFVDTAACSFCAAGRGTEDNVTHQGN